MRIAENLDVKLCVFDCETPKGVFCIGIFDPDTGEWKTYEISKYKNELYDLVHFYNQNDFKFWVGFNNIGFDHQVLQYILENYEYWFDLDGLEIAGKISEFANKVIDDGRYDIVPPYAEDMFPVNPMDLYKIHHFDNDGRRASLKWCAFMMNMSVEEMPYPHTKGDFTQQEIDELKDYMRNDIIVTYELLKLTLGETELEQLKDYKGKNKIQDRIDVYTETGMDCLNWSDVKIGEEWNKLDYKNAKAIDGKSEYTLFPKKAKHPFGQKFRNFFPSTMEFKTKKLQDFVRELGEEFVTNKKQKFPITIGNTTYVVAKGGIHSNEKHRLIKASQGFNCVDADVQSQYTNGIVKHRIHPPHLDGDILLGQVKGKVKRRGVLKDKAKSLELENKTSEARPLRSVEGMLKLCLNGGLYGKLGQKGSFLEYPEGLLKTCMANQIEILMLIEALEEAGFQVLSGNTDGIVTYYPASKEQEYKDICAAWEKKVGNHEMGKLEYTKFTTLHQESINHYIAKKEDGTVKKKGRFVTTYGSAGCEINKNKSKRVIALALEEYFINGKNPIDFITNHTNIFDFCIGKKAFGDLHYEEIISEKEVKIHKKLIVYYISNSGNVFMKRGTDVHGDPMNNHCEAQDKDFPWMGQPKGKYFNTPIKFEKFSDYDVNYSYYILETLKRIDAIEHTKKAKMYADSFKTTQGSLF